MFKNKEKVPKAEFTGALVFSKAYAPKAELKFPILLDDKALNPKAALKNPVVKGFKALSPNDVFSSFNSPA